MRLVASFFYGVKVFYSIDAEDQLAKSQRYKVDNYVANKPGYTLLSDGSRAICYSLF